jgi:hypothetical protein
MELVTMGSSIALRFTQGFAMSRNQWQADCSR